MGLKIVGNISCISYLIGSVLSSESSVHCGREGNSSFLPAWCRPACWSVGWGVIRPLDPGAGSDSKRKEVGGGGWRAHREHTHTRGPQRPQWWHWLQQGRGGLGSSCLAFMLLPSPSMEFPLSVVLICISFMAKNVKHCFKYLLAIVFLLRTVC
jgi:hypothetical protein